jgi:hypothetical protein
MFEIGVSFVDQVEDTNGPGNDEPYLIVFAADLADTGLIPVPASLTTLHGPWDIGNVVAFPVTSPLCWGFNGGPRNIDDVDNPLIVVALLESDHEDNPADFANSVRAGTSAMVLGSLVSYIVDFNAGNLSLSQLRTNVIRDMRGAVDIFRGADIEKDERLGSVQRLHFTAEDLENAQTSPVTRTLTFISHKEDSEYKITFSIGAGTGSISQGIKLEKPSDRYAAIWVKEDGPDWKARHRMTAGQYQAEFNEMSQKGFRLTHISGYNYAGSPRFAAIWEKTSGPPQIAHHNMTSKQYQQKFNDAVKDGFRLKQVSGYRGNGQDLYAAIWTKETGAAWVAKHRMTAAKYQEEFNQQVQNGFKLHDVSGYAIGDNDRYAAIWSKQPSGPRFARHGMTSAQYQSEFNRLSKEGFRVIHVSGYTVHGKRLLAAIWEKMDGPPMVARHNMTSDKYQEEFNKWVGQGYRLQCVSGY